MYKTSISSLPESVFSAVFYNIFYISATYSSKGEKEALICILSGDDSRSGLL